MAHANFAEALRRLLAHEGGYANHPSDPGGPTNWGITIHDARAHWKKGATADDVRAMPRSVAEDIYKAKYWDALRCGELPGGVDYAVFDYGVNSGIGRSGKVLRRVLGLSDATHVVTDGVLATVRARDASSIVAAICDERMAFLRRLKTWPVFGRGWSRRVADVRGVALRLALSEKTAVEPEPVRAPGKGAVPHARAAQQATAGGLVAAGGVLAHHAAASPGAALAILAAAFGLTALGWWFWHWRQRRLQDRKVETTR